jgi:hypothetical protein
LHLIRFGVRISLREVCGPPLRELGVLAPDAKLRALVVTQGPAQPEQAARSRGPRHWWPVRNPCFRSTAGQFDPVRACPAVVSFGSFAAAISMS